MTMMRKVTARTIGGVVAVVKALVVFLFFAPLALNLNVRATDGIGTTTSITFEPETKEAFRQLENLKISGIEIDTQQESRRRLQGGSTWSQVGMVLEPPNLGRFGESISISSDGTVVAVGGPFCTGPNGEITAGAVRIFSLEIVDIGSSDWIQKGSDLYGGSGFDNFGGSVSITSDGDGLAIGSNSKAFYYEWDSNSNDWFLQQEWDVSSPNVGFVAVSITKIEEDGDEDYDVILATGGPSPFGNGLLVYGYISSTNTWSQIGDTVDPNCGKSVALSSSSGTTILAAECGFFGNPIEVKVFSYDNAANGGSWQQLGSTIDTDGQDAFADSTVAISSDGTVLAVGEDTFAFGTGRARVFEYIDDDNDWSQRGSDIGPGFNIGFRTGRSVSLSDDGNILAVGSYQHPRVDVFRYDDENGNWVDIAGPIGGSVGDQFGSDVSLSSDGSYLAIGAQGAFDNAGRAAVYFLNEDSEDPPECPAMCRDGRHLVRSCERNGNGNGNGITCSERSNGGDQDGDDDDDNCGFQFVEAGWDCSGCSRTRDDGSRCCRNCEYRCQLCEDSPCNGVNRCLYQSCTKEDDGYFYCEEALKGDVDGVCSLNTGGWKCETCNRNKPDNQACCRDCIQTE